jgi:hypothetical protein
MKKRDEEIPTESVGAEQMSCLECGSIWVQMDFTGDHTNYVCPDCSWTYDCMKFHRERGMDNALS